MRGPRQPELLLVAVKICGGAPNHVVDGGAAHSLSLRDLAIGPILLPGQVQDATLMRGQEGPIEIEKAKLSLPLAGSVKH